MYIFLNSQILNSSSLAKEDLDVLTKNCTHAWHRFMGHFCLFLSFFLFLWPQGSSPPNDDLIAKRKIYTYIYIYT